MAKKFIPLQCKICESYEPEEEVCGIEPKLHLTKEACDSLEIFSHYLVGYLKELEAEIKGVKQQLKDILNKGATKYQKEKWMGEIIDNHIKKRSEVKR